MRLVLEGKIITPIITKKTSFNVKGCNVTIKKPRRRYYTKINAGKPMYPYSFESYLGTIELSCKIRNKHEIESKLAGLLGINQLGRFVSEGMGKVKWITGFIEEEKAKRKQRDISRKLRIRKGLPHDLSENIKQLLQYALLHDFYNTGRHVSKIYVEPGLDNSDLMEKLRKHHEKNTGDELIRTFQKYDRWAAMITRKIRSPITSRYNWRSTGKVDFRRLAREIKEVIGNIWKLYNFIHESKELGLLNESLQHGHTSLRKHLLVVANLIVQDYQKGILE
ncbi:MAG: hypothetical protein ACXAEU_15685 [Candidatus Hodarchaeales archaeon]|jgi:hypothetical protein